MEKKDLLEGEEIITQSDNNIVTLTNWRIRYTDSEYTRAHIVSILLEKISSIEIHYSSQILYLIVGVLAAGFGVVILLSESSELGIFIAIVGLILIALYFSSKRYLITISSDGGAKINFQAKGMNKDSILDFVNKVEKATDKRRRELK